MFRIRRIFDDILPANTEALRQVSQILRDQFPALRASEVEKLPDLLKNPLKHRFKSILYVAENFKGLVKGFALLSFEPELRFCYLDYISTAKNITGGGIGGALYERLREESLLLDAIGIFFECLPDDPALCKDPVILKQNKARLKFYEKYGAFPIVGTAYETPVQEGDDNPPYLVFDPLDQPANLSRERARKIVRTILQNRYGDLCSPDYILKVVNSIQDDPVRLRSPRYLKSDVAGNPRRSFGSHHRKVALVVNDRHEIHHVREKGYVEAPVRIRSILKELERLSIFTTVPPKEYPEKHILAVHDAGYFHYLRRVCAALEAGKSVYPYVFPIRNATRPPKDLAVRAGYYCLDTFTPLNQNAYLAARRAVDCALTAADYLLAGNRLAYALVRPPGHHAEHRSFGGFCYFNNGAVAAQYLARYGRVAILDVDYHHGNGQQTIFYQRRDVLTLSIHGHPSFAYPYFSGFEDETGEGEGEGFNINIPLPESVDGEKYLKTLTRALKRIAFYAPDFLIVCLGLDTAKGDPTGTWTLHANDFSKAGQLIGQLRIPTVVVQEGGYRNRVLGVNCRHFFSGLWQGFYPVSKD
ncbi:histone deacetylase family protein [Desulfuromonas sp. AOP6]|uniref:histone deacetylase family protein n=1 Tax=Desulfuromonas sp. AOP6 TaxID=1566351 RepID=UPI001278BF14|nr:histone deacetylase family protein [Desulfuromonas sp. AOP6]BCA79717.1 hypothetical protein AOP6_1504 [Desulfuromonas sp. AOP6]